MRIRLQSAIAIAAASLLIAALAITPSAGAATSEFKECGKVDDAPGKRSLVEEANVGCRKAKRIASRFIQKHKITRGWQAFNPAGCEYFMFKLEDEQKFQKWFQRGGDIKFPLISFTKFTGCRS